MTSPGLFYYNDKWGKTDPKVTTLVWQITGAGPVFVSVPMGPPVLPTIAALTQQQIDDFLGTTAEFNAVDFDATAMGAGTFGCIVDMQGQAASAIGLEFSWYSGADSGDLDTVVNRACVALGLTASAVETAMEVGVDGNLAFKIDVGTTPNFNTVTPGMIIVKLYWIAQ